ncbi:hypothetical protein [Demequina sp. NBRC 110055]|uniref:hypothetical protein n=1 Tax=Demequina sp. NBRC 110055 TaxID=1570344 RepID=UPI0009FC2283|nr:hypothetical protein [Demequina sp. NBRC 110055]
MAEKDNKNKRKFAAVLLGIVGVAGLSVASASQLTVTPEHEVAIGVSAAFAPCDADATVGIGYNYGKNGAGAYVITDVYLTGVDAACAGKKVTVELADAAGDIVGTATQSNVTVASGKVSVGSIAPAVLVATNLGQATVVIG